LSTTLLSLLGWESLSRDQLRKHNVTGLQATLTQLNLSSTGNKHELVDRLFQFWLDLQNPDTGHVPLSDLTVGPTSSARFRMPEHTQIANVVQKGFRKTLAEPRVFWAPTVDPDELWPILLNQSC
jgi:hypothetical protein